MALTREQHWDEPGPAPCSTPVSGCRGDTPQTAGLRGASPAGSGASPPAPPPPSGCGLCQGMLDCKLTISPLHGPGSICRK